MNTKKAKRRDSFWAVAPNLNVVTVLTPATTWMEGFTNHLVVRTISRALADGKRIDFAFRVNSCVSCNSWIVLASNRTIHELHENTRINKPSNLKKHPSTATFLSRLQKQSTLAKPRC